jgi:hypothetical protein
MNLKSCLHINLIEYFYIGFYCLESDWQVKIIEELQDEYPDVFVRQPKSLLHLKDKNN